MGRVDGTETDAVVVGGGATGVGVARDLSMRGASVVLVERDGLSAGTTGHTHGVLHSGARYADGDPDGARECIAENRILRDIAGGCLADTGGLFVSLADDDPDYPERKRDACRDCDIPVEELGGDAAREREPTLTGDIERALAVPDAVVYPSRLVAATAASAREHGAELRTAAPVADLLVEEGRVIGVVAGGERIETRHVVNATGAWTGRVAALAGVDVPMRPTRGAMVAVASDLGTILNRCRPPEDGDIAVPHGGRAILGTTSEPVDDPEDYPREEREVERVLDEGAAMLPGIREAEVLDTYWGVRPLYDPDAAGEDARAISRDFHMLDHADRDDLPGLTTIVGGKLTTHRLMAEAVADHVCSRLDIDGECRTADEPLPHQEDRAALDALVREFGIDVPADRDVVG